MEIPGHPALLRASFGQAESLTGQALGRRLNSPGVKHLVRVVHGRANVALKARCSEARKAFRRKSENRYINTAGYHGGNNVKS